MTSARIPEEDAAVTPVFEHTLRLMHKKVFCSVYSFLANIVVLLKMRQSIVFVICTPSSDITCPGHSLSIESRATSLMGVFITVTP